MATPLDRTIVLWTEVLLLLGLSIPAAAHNWVRCMYQDRKGNLWLGTRGGGVCRYDGTYFTTFTAEEGLAHNVVRELLQADNGDIWIAIEGFAPQAQALLGAHPFPGNIRELKNRVERAAILCQNGQVIPEDLDFGGRGMVAQSAPAPGSRAAGAAPGSLDLAETEKRLIDQALRVCGGNKVQAARLLGISRDALRRRLEQYPLEES